MYFATRKPRRCPACSHSPVASILWGEPAMTFELEGNLAKRRVVLGGCCLETPEPKWQCVECEARIYHERDRAEVGQRGHKD